VTDQIPDPQIPDLEDVLTEREETPESFARRIGRNASGFRRTLRSDKRRFSPEVAEDIAAGLKELGYEGNPWRIKQLRGVVRRVLKDKYGVDHEESKARSRQSDVWRDEGLHAEIRELIERQQRLLGEQQEIANRLEVIERRLTLEQAPADRGENSR
jgi:hypothetical protein